MSLFACSECGIVENTATGNYWVPRGEGQPPKCSQCATGKWHDLFPRRTPDEMGLYEDRPWHLTLKEIPPNA